MSLLANSNAIETGGYQISRSVRLRSSANAYLNRTPASAGNRQTFTLSMWVKLGSLTANQHLFNAYGSSTNRFEISYQGSSSPTGVIGVDMNNGSWVLDIATAQVFRDPSAWYHLVFAVDTTQAINTNRVKMWVNNVQASFSQSTGGGSAVWFAQNTNTPVNTAISHYFGTQAAGGNYLDGYMTEVNFIDGQALTPSSFGETDTITGSWVAKKYTGTYGTNGFYLNFSDNSAATSTTIGKDYSGNGNNWTPNNISVTAGATYDSMLDVPTLYADGGNGRGNYCVLNPLNKDSSQTVSDANLTYTGSASLYGKVNGSIGISSGKWYWEATLTGGGGSLATTIGIATAQSPLNTSPGDSGDAYGWGYYNFTGNKYNNGTSTAYGSTYTTNDVIGVAFDADAGTLTFYKNNVSQGTAFSSLTSGPYFPSVGDFATTSYPIWAFNFGQRPFSYTPPSGYSALNTQNLPTPTISNGATVMAASTYTGTGATQTIANSGNNAGSISFKPDLVWIKSRSAATDHKLTDSVRGTTKALISDTTGAETTDTNGLTAFGSTGFTIGTDTVYNNNTATYVAWQWQAGQGSSSSNTSGSITSTVSVNATAGFSIVTYTGTGANATVGHGLGVAPSMIIIKARGSVASGNWTIYNKNIGATKYLYLNSTIAASTFNHFQNTDPTSSLFYVVNDGNVNQSSIGYVAYCFAAIPGYSAFGKYTGNGSTDGPFVYLGFRPAFVMFKSSSVAGSSWGIKDGARFPVNVMTGYLFAESSGAEGTATSLDIDFLSNGFKFRGTSSDGNQSGATYIYMAFAEHPTKYANAR